VSLNSPGRNRLFQILLNGPKTTTSADKVFQRLIDELIHQIFEHFAEILQTSLHDRFDPNGRGLDSDYQYIT